MSNLRKLPTPRQTGRRRFPRLTLTGGALASLVIIVLATTFLRLGLLDENATWLEAIGGTLLFAAVATAFALGVGALKRHLGAALTEHEAGVVRRQLAELFSSEKSRLAEMTEHYDRLPGVVTKASTNSVASINAQVANLMAYIDEYWAVAQRTNAPAAADMRELRMMLADSVIKTAERETGAITEYAVDLRERMTVLPSEGVVVEIPTRDWRTALPTEPHSVRDILAACLIGLVLFAAAGIYVSGALEHQGKPTSPLTQTSTNNPFTVDPGGTP